MERFVEKEKKMVVSGQKRKMDSVTYGTPNCMASVTFPLFCHNMCL